MKKILQSIAQQQGLLYGILEKRDIADFKESAAFGTAGWTGREMKNIAENFNAFKNDYTRFRGDSKKIVIEKNVLAHCLTHLPGYFIFRGMDMNNKITIKTSKEFHKNARRYANKGNHIFFAVSVIILYLILHAYCWYYKNWSFLLAGTIIAPLLLWWEYRAYHKKKANDAKQENDFSPADLFAGSVLSRYPVPHSYSSRELRCTLNLISTPELALPSGIDAWYRKVSLDAILLTPKVKGRLVWLWKYDQNQLQVRDQVSFMTGSPTLTLKNYAHLLVPAIETPTSFIFLFPDHPAQGIFEQEHPEAYRAIEEYFTIFGEKLFLDSDQFTC